MTAECDVLIVGLGPVGAVLAGLLGDAGVDVVVAERSTEVYPLPRAAHFDHEIMRVFQRLGIVDEVKRHSRPAGAYEFRAADGRLLMSARRGTELGVSGWDFAYMFNQPGVEHALRARLTNMPRVDVRLGWSFEGLDQRPDGVTVRLTDADGDRHLLRARYVVGCDGAWSPVRESVGVTVVDSRSDEPWLVVDTIPLDATNIPTVNLQICDPARPTTCVLMGPGRHRWEFMLLPGEDAETVLADGFVEGLLAAWRVNVEIERKAVYRFHGLVADRWRDGRVIIAGDSAHQMPPFAGQGMCSGIRDAANLAWKLERVLAGDATDAILDTYQAEREPSVRDYIRLAIDMGRVVCTLDPALAAARDEEMIATLASGADPTPIGGPGIEGGLILAGDPAAGAMFPQFVASTSGEQLRLDDALGRAAWLIERQRTDSLDEPGLGRFGLDDPTLSPFRDQISRWLDEHATDAVLVKPDRYVFGTGSGGALLDAWRSAMRVGPPPIPVAA